jgi:putative ABC transport system ATP-binding protein
MSAILAVELRKQFTVAKRTIHAVRGVSFALAPSALCAIVGPSGSGKSTLLALLGGLDVPTSGDVWIGTANVGRMSTGRRTRFRAANVGFVFQAHSLVPVLTAAENVALPLTLLPLSARERARRIDAVLDDLGLRDLAHHRPGELSGGQQQRVGLARALVTAPALVLADEPTAHLDSRTARDVIDVMRTMNRRRATTIVLATHDPAVDALADEQIALCDGVIAQRDERSREPWKSSSSDSPSETCSVIPGAPSLPPPPSHWPSYS